MSLQNRLRAQGNNSFPNITASYEVKVSKTDVITEQKYFLVTFAGKRLEDEKDVEYSTIIGKPGESMEISADEMNEVIMINTTKREGKEYPKVVFPKSE